MENYEIIENLTVLTSYTLALVNGSESELESARNALIAQMKTTSDEGYAVDVLDALLRIIRNKHESYTDAAPELSTEIKALNWESKVDAQTICLMMQTLEYIKRGGKLTEAMKCHEQALQHLTNTTEFMREISLTYLRQVLSHMLSVKAFISHYDIMRSTLEQLQTFTKDEIERYGISAYMFLR